MVKKVSIFFKPQLASDPTSRAVKAALEYVCGIIRWGMEQTTTKDTMGNLYIPSPIPQTPGGSGLYKYFDICATLGRRHREWWLKSHRVEIMLGPQGENALVVEVCYYSIRRKEKFASLDFEINRDGRLGGCSSWG